MKPPKKLFNINWYYPTDKDLPYDELERMELTYLTPSRAIAKLNGRNIFVLKISPNSKWKDIAGMKNEDEHSLIHGIGFYPELIKKFRSEGYDIVWDSEEFKL